ACVLALMALSIPAKRRSRAFAALVSVAALSPSSKRLGWSGISVVHSSLVDHGAGRCGACPVFRAECADMRPAHPAHYHVTTVFSNQITIVLLPRSVQVKRRRLRARADRPLPCFS